MANATLPVFKYHPDPLATGSIEPSNVACVCCGQSRGFIYTGPVYAVGHIEEQICPWCIADGSAHQKFDAEFHDAAGVGGGREWDEVSQDVIEAVAYRTPGFSGWQQEQWWTHCGDAAQFIGRAGHDELIAAGPQAIEAIRESLGVEEDDEEWIELFEALDKDGGPTAYLFKCAKCGRYGGYQDCD